MKCQQKRKLNGIKQAYDAMKKMHRRGLVNIRYYPCKCGSFHLTHKPDKLLTEIIKRTKG